MDKQESRLIGFLRRCIGRYLLPLIGLGTSGLLVVDQTLLNGKNLVSPTLAFAKANPQTLSVIFSGMLLFAYLMQYQSQRSQRKIMDQQIQLMSAGYTPIVGVSNRKWGVKKLDYDDLSDLDTEDANRLFLDLSNSGNSTARNLQICFWISYTDKKRAEYKYRSSCNPLRRTSNASWWHTDQGGALSATPDEPTTFQADLELRRERKRRIWRNKSEDPVSVHTAFEDLEKAGVEEVEFALVLHYTTTTDQEEEIYLGAYEADLQSLKEDDMWLYRAMETKEEEIDRIKDDSF